MTGASGALIGALADASLRTSVLAGLVAVILAAFRVRASYVRHAVWTGVLIAMLLMPILPYVVPAFTISMPRPITSRAGLPIASGATSQGQGASLHEGRTANSLPAGAEGAASARATTPRELGRIVPPPVSAPPPVMSPAFIPGISWTVAIFAAYAVGVFILAARVLFGWASAHRLVRASRRIRLDARIEGLARSTNRAMFAESRRVATPVTVGITAPTVILPLEWRDWTNQTLSAVIAHEIAHVERRDSLVMLLAHINRCVFWFHPVAWWLEQALAATAEHACDERGVRAAGDGQRYAEVLLSMAAAATERGGRWSWQGVGMNGSGLLGQRIDRVLQDDRLFQISPIRRVLVGGACLMAVTFVAACRLQASPTVPELSLAEEQREHKTRTELEQFSPFSDRSAELLRAIAKGRAVSFAALEADAAPEQGPFELDALQQWLAAYWAHGPSTPGVGAAAGSAPHRGSTTSQKLLEMRRNRILWLIGHHPGSDLAGAVIARILPNDLDSSFSGDPAGYARAKALWLAEADKPDVSAAALGNASYFFETADKPLAERMLLHARDRDPDGPWLVRLGRLYAVALTGFTAPSPHLYLPRVDPGDPYAVVARAKLGESTDEVLLTAAGWFMARSMRYPGIAFDPNAWAESCFKRVLQLNPKAVLAHAELLSVSSQRRWSSDHDALWSPPASERYAWVSRLPEQERFERLPEMAEDSVISSDETRWHDSNLDDYMRVHRENAKHFAEDILKLAPKFRTNPKYGRAMYAANMTLGSLALADGDKRKAIDYLRQASRVPPSEELIYDEGLALDRRGRLARDLFAQGERDAVAEFFERMAQVSLIDRAPLLAKAAAIRRGESPRL